MVVNIALVRRKSKIAREMLCRCGSKVMLYLIIETGVDGCEGRMYRTDGCGLGLAPWPAEPAMAGVFRGRG